MELVRKCFTFLISLKPLVCFDKATWQLHKCQIFETGVLRSFIDKIVCHLITKIACYSGVRK